MTVDTGVNCVVQFIHPGREHKPDDGPSREMKGRCRAYAQTPPPADWRGDHLLTSK